MNVPVADVLARLTQPTPTPLLIIFFNGRTGLDGHYSVSDRGRKRAQCRAFPLARTPGSATTSVPVASPFPSHSPKAMHSVPRRLRWPSVQPICLAGTCYPRIPVTSPSHAQHSGLICSTLLPSALTALALATYDVGALPRRGASRAGQHSGVMGLHIRHDELSPTVIHRTNSKNRRQ